MVNDLAPTTVSCLTPPGVGAIAVIAIAGPNAWTIARQLFRPASVKPLPEQPLPLSTWFGRIGPGAGDEVILAVPSFDPEPIVEIHCHGGRQVVQVLLKLFGEQGCVEGRAERREPPGAPKHLAAYTARLAWEMLPHAKTLRTASILLDQANGVFDRVIANIQQHLKQGEAGQAQQLQAQLERFIPLGQHLIQPWRVVIAGAPNAGKSSLLNALAGYQRSVVAPVPGTTRDVVTATVAFDGWLVELADTAGLREAGDELEQEGIERAEKQIRQADLCLWVVDVTDAMRSDLPKAKRVLTVLNKIDLSGNAAELKGIKVSATSGEGIDELIRKIVEVLVPEAPEPGAAVPFHDACIRLLASQPRERAGDAK